MHVVRGWSPLSVPAINGVAEKPAQVEVVQVDGYCALATWNSSNDTVSLTQVVHAVNYGATETGCP